MCCMWSKLTSTDKWQLYLVLFALAPSQKPDNCQPISGPTFQEYRQNRLTPLCPCRGSLLEKCTSALSACSLLLRLAYTACSLRNMTVQYWWGRSSCQSLTQRKVRNSSSNTINTSERASLTKANQLFYKLKFSCHTCLQQKQLHQFHLGVTHCSIYCKTEA